MPVYIHLALYTLGIVCLTDVLFSLLFSSVVSWSRVFSLLFSSVVSWSRVRRAHAAQGRAQESMFGLLVLPWQFIGISPGGGEERKKKVLGMTFREMHEDQGREGTRCWEVTLSRHACGWKEVEVGRGCTGWPRFPFCFPWLPPPSLV